MLRGQEKRHQLEALARLGEKLAKLREAGHAREAVKLKILEATGNMLLNTTIFNQVVLNESPRELNIFIYWT